MGYSVPVSPPIVSMKQVKMTADLIAGKQWHRWVIPLTGSWDSDMYHTSITKKPKQVDSCLAMRTLMSCNVSSLSMCLLVLQRAVPSALAMGPQSRHVASAGRPW